MDVAVIHEHVFKEAKEGMEKANFEEDILEPCEYVSQNYQKCQESMSNCPEEEEEDVVGPSFDNMACDQPLEDDEEMEESEQVETLFQVEEEESEEDLFLSNLNYVIEFEEDPPDFTMEMEMDEEGDL